MNRQAGSFSQQAGFVALKLFLGLRRQFGTPLSHLWTAEHTSPLCSRASAAFVCLLTRNVYASISEVMIPHNSICKMKHGSLHNHQILLLAGYSLSDNRQSPKSRNVDSLKQMRWRIRRSLGGTDG